MSIPSGNPLNYPPGSQSPIKRVGSNRAPTSKDAKNFREGDEWLDRSSNDWYKLAKNTPSSVIWARIGGTGGAGDVLVAGSEGGNSASLLNGFVGAGGSSFYGNGRPTFPFLGFSFDVAGLNGVNYGTGGTGAHVSTVSAGQAGGIGAGGIVTITEYI